MMRLPVPATAQRSGCRHPRPLNVAHRGASFEAPENTLAAVRRAVEVGADVVEVDVQRSRDGALVLMHDKTLERTTNVRQVFPARAPWRVADLSHDELLRLDAGSWKSGAHAGEQVPTLDEVIQVILAGSASLQLELKAPQRHPGIVADLVAALSRAPGVAEPAAAASRVVVQSFHVAAMKDLKTRLPHVPVGLLGAPDVANLPALGTWADQVNPHHWSVDRSYVAEVHRRGMSCLVWTVDTPRAMRRALRLGVDGVITDRPDLLEAVIDRGRRFAQGRDVTAAAGPSRADRAGVGA